MNMEVLRKEWQDVVVFMLKPHAPIRRFTPFSMPESHYHHFPQPPNPLTKIVTQFYPLRQGVLPPPNLKVDAHEPSLMYLHELRDKCFQVEYNL